MRKLTAAVMSAGMLAAAPMAEAQTPPDPKAVTVTRNGATPSAKGPETNFTGSVRVDHRFQAPDPARVGGGLVTFEPGARTAWHTHPLGQTLFVTSGVGLVQHW